MPFRYNHKEFAAMVQLWLDDLHGDETPAKVDRETMRIRREGLVLIGLNEVRCGGHGMTWAKTMLRLYNEVNK